MISLHHICNELHQALLAELQQVEGSAMEELQQVAQGMSVAHDYLQQLERLAAALPFDNTDQEILFFKTVKPTFACRYLYYSQLFSLLAGWPAGSVQVQQDYIDQALQQVTLFFRQHQAFYRYYRTRCTHADHIYFVRGGRQATGTANQPAGEAFKTPYSNVVAQMMANDLLQQYLQKRTGNYNTTGQPYLHSRSISLTWTGRKTDLAELIYALYEQRVFNNGQTTLKEIAVYLAGVFHIPLFDYTRTYIDLRMRKTGRTAFLDALRDSLGRRMDRQDDAID